MGPTGAGDLTERVRFERRSAEGDGYGNAEGSWEVLIASRAAKLRPTRGGEQVIAARQQGLTLWDLWVVFDGETRTVNPGDRVVQILPVDVDGRAFNIKFAEDMDGGKDWLLIQLERGGADG